MRRQTRRAPRCASSRRPASTVSWAVADATAPDAGRQRLASHTSGPTLVLVDPVGSPWPDTHEERLMPWVEAYPWTGFWARVQASGARPVFVGHPWEPLFQLEADIQKAG